jgi:hypothetical protein
MLRSFFQISPWRNLELCYSFSISLIWTCDLVFPSFVSLIWTRSWVGLGFLMQVMPYAECWFYSDGGAGSMYGRWLITSTPSEQTKESGHAVVEVPIFSPFLCSAASWIILLFVICQIMHACCGSNKQVMHLMISLFAGYYFSLP